MHDPRVGRFFATDPLEENYPHNSPYAFSENDVIAHVELEGLEKASTKKNAETTLLLLGTARAVASKPQLSAMTFKDAMKLVSSKKNVPTKIGWTFKAKFVSVLGFLLTDSMSPNFGGSSEFKTQKIKTKEGVLVIRTSPSGGTSAYIIPYNNASEQPEIFTSDPSTLSDQYLREVLNRIERGDTRGSDWKYAPEAYRREAFNKSNNSNHLVYSPTDKHRKGGWGTYMDLDDKTASKVLNNSETLGKQRYGFHDGTIYEFQFDNVGGWHGYPIPGNELIDKKGGSDILRKWKDAGKMSESDYKRILKE